MLSKLREFILPEPKVSLKLYFDNVRNYAICGALLALLVWLYQQWSTSGQSSMRTFMIGPVVLELNQTQLLVALAVVTVVFALLLVLNTLQTWFLVLHALAARMAGADPFAPADDPSSPANARGHSWPIVLLASVVLALLAYVVVHVALSVAALASAFVAR